MNGPYEGDDGAVEARRAEEGRQVEVTPPRERRSPLLPAPALAAGEITAPSLVARDVHKLCITSGGSHLISILRMPRKFSPRLGFGFVKVDPS